VAVIGNGEMNKVADPGIQFRDSALAARYQTSIPRSYVVPFLLVIPVLLFFAVPSGFVRAEDGSIQPHLSANQLAAEVVQNELKAQDEDTSLWKYREFHQEDGKAQLFEVVQTKDGEIHRLVSVDGKALDAEGRRKEDQRIRKILSDPDDFREKQKGRAHDAEQERKLMTMLPRAFLYEYNGIQDGFIKLQFRPNPSFHPSGNESVVFHHMQGVMLVDPRQHRLAELDGQLLSPVKFWNGLLGHLDAGGTFCVRQRNVGGGHWEMTFLDVQMDGKALFFKTIAVREKEVDTDFRPLPGDTTLKQAAEFLKIDTAS
jgi:hypothetical protein